VVDTHSTFAARWQETTESSASNKNQFLISVLE